MMITNEQKNRIDFLIRLIESKAEAPTTIFNLVFEVFSDLNRDMDEIEKYKYTIPEMLNEIQRQRALVN